MSFLQKPEYIQFLMTWDKKHLDEKSISKVEVVAYFIINSPRLIREEWTRRILGQLIKTQITEELQIKMQALGILNSRMLLDKTKLPRTNKALAIRNKMKKNS